MPPKAKGTATTIGGGGEAWPERFPVTYDGVLEITTEAAADDTSGYRAEFLKMVAHFRLRPH
jgi:hypothetical protein